MLSGKRLSMVVAAGALILVGVLAVALFTPNEVDESENDSSKEQSVSKVTLVKPTQPPLPLGYETEKLNIEVEPVAEAAIPPIVPPLEVPKEEAKGGVVDYKVVKGDAVSKIAQAHGCKAADIYAINDGLDKSNAHKIRIGQTIKIPVGAAGLEAVKNSKPSTSEKTSVSERTIVAEARDNSISLSIDHYGVMHHFRKIIDANPHIDWDSPLKGGEQVLLPGIGDASKKSVGNTAPDKTKVERKTLIPTRH